MGAAVRGSSSQSLWSFNKVDPPETHGCGDVFGYTGLEQLEELQTSHSEARIGSELVNWQVPVSFLPSVARTRSRLRRDGPKMLVPVHQQVGPLPARRSLCYLMVRQQPRRPEETPWKMWMRHRTIKFHRNP
eukprot:symbB.v1.2.017051.t1/scaffold1314.1/size125707/4